MSSTTSESSRETAKSTRTIRVPARKYGSRDQSGAIQPSQAGLDEEEHSDEDRPTRAPDTSAMFKRMASVTSRIPVTILVTTVEA